jgi:DNA-binding NarL/FixJ family response regulator
MATTIIIIDDCQLFREGIKSTLKLEKDFIVEAFGDDSQSLMESQMLSPDVILLNMSIKEKSYDKAMIQIMKTYFEKEIKVLAIHEDKTYVTNALTMGALGFVLNSVGKEQLIKAVKVVARGEIYIDPRAMKEFVRDYLLLVNSKGTEVIFPRHILTRRECQILQLVADGESNTGIAQALLISKTTVKNHVSAILKKIEVNDRTQAVVKAVKNGWVKGR